MKDGRTARKLDLVLPTVVFLVSLALALSYVRQVGLGFFYQSYFSPAVSLACTGEFQAYRVPAEEPMLAFHDFLYTKSASFDCANFPRDIEKYKVPLSSFQRGTLYFIYLTGLLWRTFAVEWNVTMAFAAVFAGASAVAVYGIGRLFLSPIPSLILVAAAIALSPLQTMMAPFLRDYSKAPFILGFLALSGSTLLAGVSWRGRIIRAALAGVVGGVGLGFRADLLLALPFFVVTLSLLLLRERWRSLPRVIAVGAAFFGAFTLSSLPALMSYEGGGALGHVALLGLTTPFNGPLGLAATPYDIGDLYNDQAVLAFVISDAYWFGESSLSREPHWITIHTAEYSRYALEALAAYFGNFPADLLVRTYAAIIRVIGLDLGVSPTLPGWWSWIEHARRFLVVPSMAPALFLGACCVVAVADLHLSLFLLGSLAFFGGLCALQFQFRHVFHLEFFYWLSLLILATAAWRLAVSFVNQSSTIRRLRWPSVAQWKRVLTPPALVILAAFALQGARWYQGMTLPHIFARYIEAERRPVELARQKSEGVTALRPASTLADPRGRAVDPANPRSVDSVYLVARIDPARCVAPFFKMKVVYRSEFKFNDFSRELVVPLSKDHAFQLFFPVWFLPALPSYFDRLEVPEEQEPCLTELASVVAEPPLPLPLWLRLSEGTAQSHLYQEMLVPALPWLDRLKRLF